MEAVQTADRWRRSRDLEVVAVTTLWLRSMPDKDASLRQILGSMPGYDGEGIEGFR